MKKGIYIVLAVLMCMSCGIKTEDTVKGKEMLGNALFRALLYPFRSGKLFAPTGERKLAKDLYNAVYQRQIEWTKEILANGADPNYCRGESGWVDSNPLNVVSESHYTTYYRRLRGEVIPEPALDVAIFTLLIEAGADINRRPYIWNRVHLYKHEDFNRLWKSVMVNGEYVGVEADLKESSIKDANRLLEAFLKAGADPDKLGHPYPFSSEAMYARITDEEADTYFAQGTRAINEAIKKGMAWESQVDLLLQYTSLDEKSLEAAQESNDPAMIEKIHTLWQEQQNGEESEE